MPLFWGQSSPDPLHLVTDIQVEAPSLIGDVTKNNSAVRVVLAFNDNWSSKSQRIIQGVDDEQYTSSGEWFVPQTNWKVNATFKTSQSTPRVHCIRIVSCEK